MGKKNKLRRFADIARFENVFEYTIYLAEQNPDKNYIGIDLKGNRIWKGAKYALENGMKNVHFIRMLIDHLPDYFDRGEVDEIWITFPDPQPRGSRAKQRLTSPKFLEIYRQVTSPGCTVHLKTDSNLLFNFTLETIEEESCNLVRIEHDIYKNAPGDDLLTHKTFYERQHLKAGKTIHYVSFQIS